MGSFCSCDQSQTDTPTQLIEETVYGIKFIVSRGDILNEVHENGAIVNPTNNKLINTTHSQSFTTKAGEPNQDESNVSTKKSGELKVGDILYAKAENLKIKYILETICPFWTGGLREEEDKLEICVRSCLDKAFELGIETLVYPFLSDAIFTFPKHLSAEITIRTCISFAHEYKGKSSIKCIKFINKDQLTVKAFKEEFQKQLSLLKNGKGSSIISHALDIEKVTDNLENNKNSSVKN